MDRGSTDPWASAVILAAPGMEAAALGPLLTDWSATPGMRSHYAGYIGSRRVVVYPIAGSGYVRRWRNETDRRRVVVELDHDAASGIAPLFASLGEALEAHFDTYSTGELRQLLGFVTEVNHRVAETTASLRQGQDRPARNRVLSNTFE